MKRILGIILAVGLAFRLLFLGNRQLWTEELMQALVARSDSLAAMVDRLRGGVFLSAPLDYVVQKGFVLVFGESGWSLRLHAAVFGTLSLWFFFRVARLLFGDRVALYSTALFAFFPLHYHYSQEGQPYSLFVFLTLVSFDLLLRKVSGPDKGLRGWMILSFVLVLLLYTSFLGAVVLVSQCITVILAAWLGARSPAGATVQDADAGAPEIPSVRWSQVAAYVLCSFVACALLFPWAHFAWSIPAMVATSELANPRLLLRLLKELGDNSYPVTGMLLAGVITGCRAMRRHGRSRSLLWLLTWSLVSIPVVLLLDGWLGYYFTIGQILHATPPLVLLAGYGLSYVGERLTILDRLPFRLSSPAIVYAGILALMSVWIAQSHWRREQVDWKGVARYLQETVGAGDAVAIPTGFPLLEYYSPSLAEFKSGDMDPGPGSLAVGGVNRRFVVCLDGTSPDPCSGIRAVAAKDRAWTRREYRGLTVFFRGK